MIKFSIVRVVLTLALNFGWSIKQIVVNNAFFNGMFEEKVYIEQPEGFIDASFPCHVFHLHKAIYGLKQAPRVLFDRLKFALLKLGFVASKVDVSLYTKVTSSTVLYMLIYIDDIILTGSSTSEIHDLILDLYA